MKFKYFLMITFSVLAPLTLFWGCGKSTVPVTPASVSNVKITIPTRNTRGQLLGASENTFLYCFTGSGAPVTGSEGPIPSSLLGDSYSIVVNLPANSSYNFVGLQLNDGTTQQVLAIGASTFSSGSVGVTLGPVNKPVYQVSPLGAGQAFGFEADTTVNVGENTATSTPGLDVECNITADSTGFELDNAALANSTIAYMGNGNFVNFLQLPPSSDFKTTSIASKALATTSKDLAPGDVYCIKMSTGYAWLQITSVGTAGPVFLFRVNTTLSYCGYEQSTADTSAINAAATANPNLTPTPTPAGFAASSVYAATGAGAPYDVAVMSPASGAATAVFVPDSANGDVYEFSGGVTYQIINNTHISKPIGLTVVPSGPYLYVADPVGQMVDQYQPLNGFTSAWTWNGCIGDGAVVSSTDTPQQAVTGALSAPRYTSFDNSGNLFITDTGTTGLAGVMEYDASSPTLILAVDPTVTYWNGSFSATPSSNGIGQIANAGATVIVADSDNSAVELYSPTGTLYKSLSSDNNPAGAVAFLHPQGVAYSSSTGLLYISDTGRNRIVVMSPSGTFVTVIGPALGGSYGSLSGPTGIKLDNANPPNVYVADSGNNRVVVFGSF